MTVYSGIQISDIYVSLQSLQLLPPTSIPDLLPILHLCNPLGIPVARALLERLVSFARTPESKSFISVIVAEGISASRRLKTLELIVPLLSCFPRYVLY